MRGTIAHIDRAAEETIRSMDRIAMMWFRRDLRLADNAAVASALSHGDSVAFVASAGVPEAGAPGAPGAASAAWRAGSLAALDAALRERSGGANGLAALVGEPAPAALTRLARDCGATSVRCTRVWTPAGLAEEQAARAALAAAGIALEVSEGSLLVTPDALQTSDGGSFKVFTPFHRAWEREWVPGQQLPAPHAIPSAPSAMPVAGTRIAHAAVAVRGIAAVEAFGTPGEAAALDRLRAFIGDCLASYERDREMPVLDGTSRLSVAIAHGEVSPRQVACAVYDAGDDIPQEPRAAFLRQLAWREFAAHVMHHSPGLAQSSWREEFDRMPWQDDPDGLAAWQSGTTGVPLVDAGMRQLAETGWMHNRVRLVVASFLTKDLLIDWREGQAHFADALFDADIAQNAFNWQWVAGSGADAAPYFRIFNPAVQGERFDVHGEYVRRWVPELASLPDRYVHRPWDALELQLTDAGVTLGETYPHAIVDHAFARTRALATYREVTSHG